MTWFATTEHCAQYDAVTQAPFEDVACLYQDTWLGKTYMNWEFSLSSSELLQPPSWELILTTVVMSGMIQYFGVYHVMKYRPAWQIRFWVTFWNALWLILSVLGFLRMAPAAYHNLSTYSIRDNVCGDASSLWLSGTTRLWTLIWLWSKLVEVIVESVLVVVLKQPSCGLLQWYNNYAYVVAHGWHLYTAPVPGGFTVIATYYGIVATMNAYCFYLNLRRLPQPQGPTFILDLIQLIQTLSGVFLSITTLRFWKAALHNPRYHCWANEPHIRTFSFLWSGGHGIIGIIYLFRRFVLKSLPEQKLKQQQQMIMKQQQHQHKMMSGAELEKEKDRQKRLQQVAATASASASASAINEITTGTKKKTRKNKKQPTEPMLMESMKDTPENESTSASESGNGDHHTGNDTKWTVVGKDHTASSASSAVPRLKSEEDSTTTDHTDNPQQGEQNTAGAEAITSSKKKKKKNKNKKNKAE